MTDALCLDSTARLVFELHDFIREIDAARWRREMEEALHRRLEALDQRLNRILEEEPEEMTELEVHPSILAELASVLREYTPDTSLPRRAARRQWMRLRVRLLPTYEALASNLRAREVVVPPLRPTNTARIALHLSGMSIALVLLLLALPFPALVVIAGLSAGTCWVLETLRVRNERMNQALMKFFRHVAHPLEARKVNSATWFATALFVLSWLDSPLISGAAVVVLGVGDPIAGLVGRRWGRRQLLNNRTVEGSLAFVGAAALAVCAYVLLAGFSLSLLSLLVMAGAAALSGATAELLSRRLDDNFTIPLCAAAAAWLALWLTTSPLG